MITGKGMTREDHGAVSNQLYASYARGKDAIAMKVFDQTAQNVHFIH